MAQTGWQSYSRLFAWENVGTSPCWAEHKAFGSQTMPKESCGHRLRYAGEPMGSKGDHAWPQLHRTHRHRIRCLARVAPLNAATALGAFANLDLEPRGPGTNSRDIDLVLRGLAFDPNTPMARGTPQRTLHRHPLIDPLRSGADSLAAVLTTRFASGRLRIRLWLAFGERRRLALAPAAQIIDHSLKLDNAPSQLCDPPVPLGKLLTKLSYDFKQLVVTRPVHISFHHGRQEPDTVNRYPRCSTDFPRGSTTEPTTDCEPDWIPCIARRS